METKKATGRGPRGGRYEPTRSFRLSEEKWAELRERAASEGLSTSAVVTRLVDGYLEGHYAMPEERVIYPSSK